MQSEKIIDLLVIGGGINGTGIALDAAGRGLSVVLCEQNDLASGTSCASTKLIHGGLRYLEHYDFKLVREALNEREVLLAKAPHLISPQRFIIPHEPQLRPYWMIRLGLWIYDHLGKYCTLDRSQGIQLSSDSVFGCPLKKNYTRGFAFSDCWVDDARLVIANALGAFELGADILSYTEVKNWKVVDGIWQATLYDKLKNENSILHAKAIVDATGPWIKPTHHRIRLVRGSHIIVPKRYEGEHAYLIQHPDGRIVFVIPYQHNFTLIGTTEVQTVDLPEAVHISPEEKNYLMNIFNEHFEAKISAQDIVWTYSGVRPLVDDDGKTSTELSRDYLLEVDVLQGAPILSVYGGKITTYRTLAESALDKLSPFFPGIKPAWTKKTPLPGGDCGPFQVFFETLQHQYPWLSSKMLRRLAHQYGSRIHHILSRATCLEDLGQNFDADCYEKELLYLIQHEWARTVEDILYRRTKLGLHVSLQAQEKIKTWLSKNLPL